MISSNICFICVAPVFVGLLVGCFTHRCPEKTRLCWKENIFALTVNFQLWNSHHSDLLYPVFCNCAVIYGCASCYIWLEGFFFLTAQQILCKCLFVDECAGTLMTLINPYSDIWHDSACTAATLQLIQAWILAAKSKFFMTMQWWNLVTTKCHM